MVRPASLGLAVIGLVVFATAAPLVVGGPVSDAAPSLSCDGDLAPSKQKAAQAACDQFRATDQFAEAVTTEADNARQNATGDSPTDVFGDLVTLLSGLAGHLGQANENGSAAVKYLIDDSPPESRAASERCCVADGEIGLAYSARDCNTTLQDPLRFCKGDCASLPEAPVCQSDLSWIMNATVVAILPDSTLQSKADLTPDGAYSWEVPASLDGTYGFFTILVDQAGNVEPHPTTQTLSVRGVSVDMKVVVDRVPPISALPAVPWYTRTPSIPLVPDCVDPATRAVDGNVSGVRAWDLYASLPGQGLSPVGASPFLKQRTVPGCAAATFTAQSPGLYRFRSLARDAAGNAEPAESGSEASTIFDATPPVPTLVPRPVVAAAWNVDGSCRDPSPGASVVASGLVVCRIDVVDPSGNKILSRDAESASCPDPRLALAPSLASVSGQVPVTTDGPYSVIAVASDCAGNTATTVGESFLDRAPPSVRITTSDLASFSGSPVRVTFEASDPGPSSGLATIVCEATSGAGTIRKSMPIQAGPQSCELDVAQGAWEVVVTAADAAGNVASAAAVHIVLDKSPPTVSLMSRSPANGGGWNNGDVVVAWRCDDPLSGPIARSITQIVTAEGVGLSATGACMDHAGNSANDTRSGIKIDKTPPIVSSHEDVIVDAMDASGAVVHYEVPLASDPLSGAETVTCAPASGSAFPQGSTLVACSVTDLAGNIATSTFHVIVIDRAPVIEDHEDVVADAAGTPGAAVAYELPATYDRVDGDGVASCTPASGATFPLGSTDVVCMAVDSAGNLAAPTTFVVRVRHATSPTTDAIASLPILVDPTPPHVVLPPSPEGLSRASVASPPAGSDLPFASLVPGPGVAVLVAAIAIAVLASRKELRP